MKKLYYVYSTKWKFIMIIVRKRALNYSLSITNLFICVLLILTFSQVVFGADNWPFEITSQARPGTRFWIPGNALDKDNIDWNLEQLEAAGFGTIEVTPIYGAIGYEDRYIDYLSPEWMEMFGYMVSKAKKLGMQVDMVTGTGWNFGGPDIPRKYQDIRVNWQADKKEIGFIDGRMVKRAAPDEEGYMLNPFSPDAMDYYLQRFTKAFETYTGILPRAQYNDSFEYKADWTADLFDQFQKRRGYDLKPHLETFFNETSEDYRELKTRLKYDYRCTLEELHFEYIQKWVQWSKDRGMLTRNQAHCSPTNLLDNYALADIPETEMIASPDFPIPGFRQEPQYCTKMAIFNLFATKMASSAAHVGHQPDRQLVCSESFTWLREHWHTTLGQMKLSADLFFLSGANHMFYHGTCYSPKDVPWPGWFFYASVHADWRNSIWRDISYLNDYIARSQSFLQSSQPANDVLVYWPIHDLWMNPEDMCAPIGIHYLYWITENSIAKISDVLQKEGFTFDYISDRLLQKLSFSNGLIQAPGATYRAIIVPVSQYIPIETLDQLTRLSKAGVPVIFEETLPQDVPGLKELEQQREAFAVTKSKLKKTTKVTSDVIQSLTDLKIAREPMVDSGLSFIRRKTDNHYWYFIANHSADVVNEWIPLGVTFKSALAHDPMTGKTYKLAVKQSKGESQIYLQIAPGQSMILQTSNTALDAPQYKYSQPCGQAITLQGPWKVEFIEGAPEPPKPKNVDKLVSWTEFPDPAVESFAGTACYTIHFDVTENSVEDWVLDLGDVRESARICINGQDAGVLFAVPYKMNIGQFLKAGKNTLEVEVTNLTTNRIRALDKSGKNWKIMKDANIVNVDYKEFQAKDWPLRSSGLLGPVQLIPIKKVLRN